MFLFVQMYVSCLVFPTAEMEAGAVLLLGPLDADLSLRNSGAPDAAASGS